MLELIYIAVIIIGFVTAYIVSLYSLAVFIDPDEIDDILPNVSAFHKKILLRMADDSRALIQVAEIFKSFVLVLVSFMMLLLLEMFAHHFEISMLIVNIFGLLFIWFLYLAVVEIFPRYRTRSAVNEKMIKHLWIFSITFVLFQPIIKIYRAALLRSESSEHVTEEDKEDILERAIETVAERAGIGQSIVDDEEKEMINQIFLLDQTVVREIMVPRVNMVGIDKKMTFTEIRELVTRDGHSRYPVYDDTIDKIIGLIYVKDLFNKMPEAGEKFNINKYLRKPYLVPETKVIGDLLREFKNKRQHIAVVIDEYGGIAGLVTLEDIIEEIFGEIQDEHDRESDEIVQLAQGLWLVDANMMVEKLQDTLDTEFDQEDYDSIGGLIYDLVGSVPEEGRKIKWNSFEFTVEEVEGQRIKTVKVKYNGTNSH